MSKANTKVRIIDTALILFNEFGAPNVSTNHIADTLDISPGNLYYHFTGRGEIVDALFARFERAMLHTLVLPDKRLPDAEDIWFFLHLILEVQVTYRFWYRDLNEMVGRHMGLKKRFQGILEVQQQAIQELLNRLTTAKLIEASALERATLARNILLVLNTWLSFSDITPDRLNQNPSLAVWQVMSLVVAYLTDVGREDVKNLAGMYLD